MFVYKWKRGQARLSSSLLLHRLIWHIQQHNAGESKRWKLVGLLSPFFFVATGITWILSKPTHALFISSKANLYWLLCPSLLSICFFFLFDRKGNLTVIYTIHTLIRTYGRKDKVSLCICGGCFATNNLSSLVLGTESRKVTLFFLPSIPFFYSPSLSQNLFNTFLVLYIKKRNYIFKNKNGKRKGGWGSW